MNATTRIRVTDLTELTRANGPFKGCSILKPDTPGHHGKGEVKNRAYVLVPFSKFNGEAYAQLEGLDLCQLGTQGFAVMLKGTGGRTARDPVERLSAGIALLMSTETRIDALRAKLGGIDYAKFAELLDRFYGSDAQVVLAVLNRADAMTREGSPVTFDTLIPAPRSK